MIYLWIVPNLKTTFNIFKLTKFQFDMILIIFIFTFFYLLYFVICVMTSLLKIHIDWSIWGFRLIRSSVCVYTCNITLTCDVKNTNNRAFVMHIYENNFIPYLYIYMYKHLQYRCMSWLWVKKIDYIFLKNHIYIYIRSSAGWYMYIYILHFDYFGICDIEYKN